MTHEINIADFAAFCRSKGDEAYDYLSNCGCALATYFVEVKGMSAGYNSGQFAIGGDHWTQKGVDGSHVNHVLPPEIANVLHVGNYQRLADRLEALLPVLPAKWTKAADYLAEPVA